MTSRPRSRQHIIGRIARRLLVGSAVLAAAAACASTPETSQGERAADQVSAQTAQQTWDAAEIESYQWTYTSTCGENNWITANPLTVHVNPAGSVLAETATRAAFQPATVDAVLIQIRDAETNNADLIEVTYGEHGQPLSVNIDYLIEAADDEFCLDVTNFTIGTSAVLDPTRVGCDGGPFFPITALEIEPSLINDSDVAEVDTAMAAFLANEEGAFWPQTGWRVLEAVPETYVLIVHPGDTNNPTVSFMTFSRTPSGWEWTGASSHDNCPLIYEPSRPDLSRVDWTLATTADASLGPDSMSFTVEATERACASGQALGQRLNEPHLFITEDEVRLELTADRLEGSQECPGNPSQQVEIQLPGPLGQRRIVDGRLSELGPLQPILLRLIERN